MIYAAYGTNLDLTAMSTRAPTAKPVGVSFLKDSKLVWRSGYPDIENVKGSYTPVGLFEIDDVALSRLDNYEGYPHFYTRDSVILAIFGEALVYHQIDQTIPRCAPGSGPVQMVVRGYQHFGLPLKYLQESLFASHSKMGEMNILRSIVNDPPGGANEVAPDVA